MDAAARLADRLSEAARAPETIISGEREAFAAALENDLNTTHAIGVLQSIGGAPLRDLGSVLGLTFQN